MTVNHGEEKGRGAYCRVSAGPRYRTALFRNSRRALPTCFGAGAGSGIEEQESVKGCLRVGPACYHASTGKKVSWVCTHSSPFGQPSASRKITVVLRRVCALCVCVRAPARARLQWYRHAQYCENARVQSLAHLRVLELLICQQVALRRPCKHLQQLNIPDADLKCRLPPSFPGRINTRMGTVDHGCQLHLRLRGSSGRDDPEILQRPKNTNTLSERVVVAIRRKQDGCPSGD